MHFSNGPERSEIDPRVNWVVVSVEDLVKQLTGTSETLSEESLQRNAAKFEPQIERGAQVLLREMKTSGQKDMLEGFRFLYDKVLPELEGNVLAQAIVKRARGIVTQPGQWAN